MFARPIRLFRLWGIPVRFDPSWLVIALLVSWSLATKLFPAWQPGLPRTAYWTMGIVGALGLFASIVVHELSHALVARRHRIPIRGIILFLFGGVAEMEAEPPSAKAELGMAIAGPITSIAIGLVALAGAAMTGVWPAAVTTVWSYLGVVNLALAAFNILPAFPLDGGRVFRALLWRRHGDLLRATRTASRVGKLFGVLLMGLGMVRLLSGDLISGLWSFLIGVFLLQAADASYQQVLVRRALDGESVRQLMTVGPITVRPSITLAEFIESYVYRYHHKLFPVQDNGRLLGVISTDQVRHVPRAEWPFRKVSAVAVPLSNTTTVAPDTQALEALTRMREQRQSRLLVVERGRLAGMVTAQDLLNFLTLKLELAP